jgi:hypothetical protein
VAESDIAAGSDRLPGRHIDSVLALELLLLLRGEPARDFTAGDLAGQLKIDPAHADEQLARFHHRGLLARTDAAPPAYRYAPQSPALDATIAAVAAAYASRRVTMIGLIFSKPTATLKTFADAFRIRGAGGKTRSDPTMAEAVYILCALTSAACAVMLLRGYLRTRTRFLLWSALCFAALFVNNVMLVIDKVFVPDRVVIDPAWRAGVALVGLSLLIFGLVWDAE